MTVKNNSAAPLRVLVVCLGNICRSPAAQGILDESARARGVELVLDSAGTAAYHVGNQADPRSIAELLSRGIDIRAQSARQVSLDDFEDFDWILAMDKSNLSNLMKICPKSQANKVRLFSSFNLENINQDVEDPYYGADDGFAHMADHLARLSQHFLDYIETNP